MKIDLTRTKDAIGESFSFEISEVLPDFEYNGTTYRIIQPVIVSGFYQPGETELMVTAEISACLAAPCDRCVTETEVAVDAAMAEVFSLIDSEETYLFAGNDLVIDKAVMDNIVLNMPMHVLCSEDCRGLCPHCGKDRNKENCDCETEKNKANSPFAALDGLFSD